MPPRSYHIFAGGGDSTFPSSGGAGAPRRGGAPAPEPIPEYRRVRTVFIHNMPPEIGEKELIRLAMPFGEIERVHYAWHMTGEKRGLPRGFATVEYKDISCAEAAIAGINGQTHYSRTIRARAFTDSSFDEHDQSGSGADRGPSSQSASSGAAEGSLSSLPLRAKIATLEAHLRALEDAEEVPAGGAGEERLVFPEQAAALERAAGAAAAGQGVSDRGRHSNDRDSDRHRDRDRARDYDHERGRDRDYDRNDRDRDRGRDYDRDRDRGHSDRGRSDRGRNWDRDSRSR